MTEQPIIHFRNEIVLYNLVAGTSYGYSSVSDLSELFENQIVSPTVKVTTNKSHVIRLVFVN